MNQIWQMWPGQIHPEFIKQVISTGEQGVSATAGLGFDGSTDNQNYRSSDIKWINCESNQNISNLLWSYAKIANKNAFGFDVNYLNDIQFTTYKASENGKYDWHHDTFWGNPSMSDRKLSLVMQLTDPFEYEGGDFHLDHQYQQPNREDLRKKGTIIVFPSFIKHCVTPVTKGTRQSLVAWFEGPKFR